MIIDITIIELRKNDKIDMNSFLEIDDNINKDKPNEIYNQKSVYLIHYPHGHNIELSNGVIKSIDEDNYTIYHLCSTEAGSSGCPIINLINFKVIGIHKGSKSEKNYNLGTLIKIPIKEFNKKNRNKKKKLKKIKMKNKFLNLIKMKKLN